MIYQEENMLMLSGIQHYMFCPRQWALIHLEQQWDDNRLTVEGQLLHINVDNPQYRQKNGNTLTLRSVSIASKTLGLYGITDAIELIPSDSLHNTITHSKYPGYWTPYPIEYKRGSEKPDERDMVQLTAQIICLEEMYNIQIEEGALYYGETKHRSIVKIDDELRNLTYNCASKMHEIYETGITPKPIKKSHCRSCSLVDVCLPGLAKSSQVSTYLENNLYEEIT